jgi:hypothetical protein
MPAPLRGCVTASNGPTLDGDRHDFRTEGRPTPHDSIAVEHYDRVIAEPNCDYSAPNVTFPSSDLNATHPMSCVQRTIRRPRAHLYTL